MAVRRRKRKRARGARRRGALDDLPRSGRPGLVIVVLSAIVLVYLAVISWLVAHEPAEARPGRVTDATGRSSDPR